MASRETACQLSGGLSVEEGYFFNRDSSFPAAGIANLSRTSLIGLSQWFLSDIGVNISNAGFRHKIQPASTAEP